MNLRISAVNYPIHVGTDISNWNGAHLTVDGVRVNGSSGELKENLQPLDSSELLERLSRTPVEAWNYRGTDERCIEPVAEDFVEAFDVGTIREEDDRRENQYWQPETWLELRLQGSRSW